ncbi:MAG: class I SAM-dependent methyltransferase [Nanoarchaeota archaeon]|nr:class I SAM-dependent methyltransferase [Nanoarchaeota archaeon]
MHCRICHNQTTTQFLDLGESPLANNLLTKEDLHKKELKYPLATCFCNHCKLVQLSYVVPPEKMFKHYVYVSSTTKTFREHFTKMAETISKTFQLGKGKLAVDIGSNDGLLLKGFKTQGLHVVGVEPATNLAKLANKADIFTLNEFWNAQTVRKIKETYGQADVITANNVFAHIDNIHDVTKNVYNLLGKDGIFVIEAAYLLDMLKDMTFDMIYHEHLCYYTLTPLIYFFRMHNMEVFDVEHVPTHGGSLRVYVKKKEGKWKIQPNVQKILWQEYSAGIHDYPTYETFANKVYTTKEKFTTYLKQLKKEKKIIIGYGAPAKATTILNFCQLGTETIDYIIEDNLLKVGLTVPGVRIPIKGAEALQQEKPDYAVILAWNFAEEILKKTKEHQQAGIKFIVPFPELKTVG